MLRSAVVVLHKCVDRLVLVCATVVFLICVYATYDAAMVYFNANDTGVLKYKPEIGSDPEVLRELSEDAIAWVTIDGTNIDYPVMQGENNAEYINKDPYGDFSLSGSIFLDSRNDASFFDPYSLLYGHHMEYGMMFGALDSYFQKDYLDAHRTGRLITTSGTVFDIRVFASMEVLATEGVVFDPPTSGVEVLLAYAREHATVFEGDGIDEEPRILGLSTCTSAESLQRTVVLATLNESSAVGNDA